MAPALGILIAGKYGHGIDISVSLPSLFGQKMGALYLPAPAWLVEYMGNGNPQGSGTPQGVQREVSVGMNRDQCAESRLLERGSGNWTQKTRIRCDPGRVSMMGQSGVSALNQGNTARGRTDEREHRHWR